MRFLPTCLVKGLLIAVTLAGMSFSQPAFSRSEYEIKAAYLYNFMKFVKWQPARLGETDDLNVCLLGRDPFEEIIDPIEGKTAQGKTIRLHRITSLTDKEKCEVLFVGEIAKGGIAEVIENATAREILTISDLEDFARDGGMVGFIKIGNVIKFEINLAKARQANIFISSKLLEIAQEVYQ